MRSLPFMAGLLVAAAFTGCIDPAVDPAATTDLRDADAVWQDVQALVADLPCEATAVGDETSDNLRELAHLPYEGGVHGEIDAAGDWMLAARYQDGGFELVSLADPAAPRLAATWQSEEASGYDVKWMPDARTAVVGHGRHVSLVDVGPAIDGTGEPQLVSEWAYPTPPPGKLLSNMHMLATHRIGGEDHVFVTPNDDTGVWILKLVGEGDARELETVTNVGEPVGGGPLDPHDMSVYEDPFLEAPILYVANGFEGWLAWDVSDPADPQLLAVAPNVGLGPAQYTHTIGAAKVGDRRIVATVGEVGTNTLRVFDATDFSRPVLLAEWASDWTRTDSPQHNVQVVGERLYVAHYAKGVYVFDLATLGTTPYADTLSLEPVAHYAPPQAGTGFDNVWDVVVHRGLLYVNDMQRGTAAVGYGCLTPGDEAHTSTA